MKTNKQKPNIMLVIATILLILVFVTTNLLSGMYARYMTTNNSNDGGSVAAFVFDVKDENDNFELDLSNIKKPGDTFEYTFEITNTSTNSISSEVAMRYVISIEELGSLPLTYKITENNGEKVVLDKTINNNLENNIFSIIGDFDAGVVKTITYTLYIEWPSEYNDIKYASGSGLANLKIAITCEQID